MKRTLFIILAFVLFGSAVQAQIQTPIKWSYAANKLSTNEAIVYIKASIEKGWHIYSLNQIDGGPQKTTFSFTKDRNHTLVGKLNEPKPIKKFEEVFGMDVLYFENSVMFTQKVKLNAKNAVIKGKVTFMACTNKECLPPDEVEFSIPVK